MDSDCIGGLELHRKHNGKYNTAIDVGVCWGGNANTYCKFFDKVIGFEPNWKKQIQNSIQEFKNKNKNFICFQYGLGRYDQENVEFWSCSEPGLSSCHLENIKTIEQKMWKWNNNITEPLISVKGYITLKKLDTVVDLYFSDRSIDLIKIDAEGKTLDILYGGVNTIQKHKPNLQTERDVSIDVQSHINHFMDEHQYQQYSLDFDHFWVHKDNL